MHLVPPPNARDLLPPLLACLPTSFLSPRPPPALLPLLSPLLRQRVTYLSGNLGNDGWLPLLSWDSTKGSRLPGAVQAMDLEPHPVSGELELEEPGPAEYKRPDEETLHARLKVDQFGLLPIYVWCEKDEHGGTEPGWKLAELRTLDDEEGNEKEWFETISEANDAVNIHSIPVPHASGLLLAQHEDDDDDDDGGDDDYWNAYDQASAHRTPAKRSPAPFANSASVRSGGPQRQSEEDDYYARYGEEVQPAMDSHDPDEDQGAIGESNLDGNSVLRLHSDARPSDQTTTAAISEQAGYLRSLQPHSQWKPHDSALHSATEQSINGELSMPRPISPADSHSSVDRLEECAAQMTSESDDRAQLAIKQHISTDIKSLYRLAKTSGMNRHDFSAIVRRQLQTLSFMDDE